MAFLLKLWPLFLGLAKLVIEAIVQSVAAEWVMKKLFRKKAK